MSDSSLKSHASAPVTRYVTHYQMVFGKVLSTPTPAMWAACAFFLAAASGGAQTTPASETDQQIHALQERVRQAAAAHLPPDYLPYDELGQAYLQKTRETGDVAFFDLAAKALSKAIELAPGDFRAADPFVHMALLNMGEHNFSGALEYSQKAIALGAGNLPAFAIEGDAYTDRGEYAKAAEAYGALQALGNTVGSPLTLEYMLGSRMAYLSFLRGNSAESIRLMKSAIAAGMQTSVPHENLAWLYFELGERYFQSGDVANAGRSYATGIAIDPDHYRALAGLAKVRAAEGNFAESIRLYKRSIDIVPFPQYVEELGDVYQRGGHGKEAEQEYDLVEYIGHLSKLNQVLANRELAMFYADHDRKLPQALQLARNELTVRSDIYTWDTLAWALYKNARFSEAGEAMCKALQLKTEDPLLLFHAGMIDHALGRDTSAEDLLNRALGLNPHFHVLFDAVAARTLAGLKHANQAVPGGAQ